ncbi:MAG: QueT transporter family protein [Lachnospiraceae bacterium]|nr:QueT transporter family protein [Lachnospiraceae bacterium]
MKKKIAIYLVQTVVIAALYWVLTYIANMFQLANGLNFQLRISDARTVLPYYTPAAVPGLFLGCLGANYTMGLPAPDVIYGSLATCVAALVSYFLRRKKFMVPFPPIIIIAFTVPAVYKYLLGFDEPPFWRSVLMVGLGEVVTCGVLGVALLLGLEDYRDKLFPTDKQATDAPDTDGDNNKEVTGENSKDV